MPRTSIAVEEGIARELAALAREKKMTLYAFVNEVFGVMIKLMKEGAEPRDIDDLWNVYKILSEADAVVLPSRFMDEIIAKLYENHQAWLFQMFNQLGRETSTLIRLHAQDLEQLINLASSYIKYLPIKDVKSRYLGDCVYEIGLIGVGGRIESTKCVLEFIKGLLSEYNASIIEQKVSPGVIHLKIRERKD